MTRPKSKILCTGSAGFIFSNFVRMVLREYSDYEIVSVDKIMRPEGIHNIYSNKDHTFHIGDVVDRHFMDTVFKIEQPDIVIHGAAESFVDDAIQDPTPFITSNVLGTQVVIDKCLEYKARLILISTDEVYGHLENDSEPAWKEDAPIAPRNAYSASKAAAELLVHAAGETHGLNYNITRSCNNFGPRQSPKNMIPKIIKCILNNSPIPIYGQGLQMREWIYVYDNCKAIIKIIENGKSGETYNISTGFETTNLDLVNKICNIMDGGHKLISFVEDRAGHDFRYAIDNTKLKSLGWAPTYGFVEGLQACTKWFNSNRWYFNS